VENSYNNYNKNEIKVNRSLYHRYDKNDKNMTQNEDEIGSNYKKSYYGRFLNKGNENNKKLKEEIEEPKVDKSANFMSSYTRRFYKNKFSSSNINNDKDEKEENANNNRSNYSNYNNYNYNNKYSKYRKEREKEKEKEKEKENKFYYGKYYRKRTEENSINNGNENNEEDDDRAINDNNSSIYLIRRKYLRQSHNEENNNSVVYKNNDNNNKDEAIEKKRRIFLHFTSGSKSNLNPRPILTPNSTASNVNSSSLFKSRFFFSKGKNEEESQIENKNNENISETRIRKHYTYFRAKH
jgi:hypothetical protein